MRAPRAEYPISYNRPFNAYSSPITDEVPPLLINKVFPAYMRHAIAFNARELDIINLSALTITAPTVNDPRLNIIHTIAHSITWTLLPTIAKMTMMKKMKMMSLINFLIALNIMTMI
jgi:hypothetical protein